MKRRLLWNPCVLILTAVAWPSMVAAEEFGLGARPPTPEEKAYVDAVYTEVIFVEPNDVSRERARAEHDAARLAGRSLPWPAERPSAADNSTLPTFPPIRSQGSQNSCVAWASCYYYNTYTQARDEGIDVSGGDNDYICSPAFMYPLINGGKDSGSSLSYAMGRLCDIGCCSWSLKPYSSSDYTSWPSEAAWVDALKRRTAGAGIINGRTPEGIETIKQHLANGNLAVALFDVYANLRHEYPNSTTGIDNAVYYCPDGNKGGGHAVTLVGYDDNRAYLDHRDGQTHYGAFLMANSWGTSWGAPNSTGAGTNGFFWVAYEMLLEGTFGTQIRFTYDRDDYRPRAYAAVGINHAERGRVRLRAGIGNPTWPDAVSAPAINYHGGSELGIDDSQRVAVDLTDFLALMAPDRVANLFVELTVSAGASSAGTITSADFYTDIDGDETYDLLSSPHPTVTAAAGTTECACAVTSGAVAWYVDDDNQAGPWDGSWAHPYSAIQSAVDACLPDDLVLVAPGRYAESLVVDHDCSIDGCGTPRTVLEPSVEGPAIHIASGADVTVSDLTVRGTAAAGVEGISVSDAAGHVTQCRIHTCERGLTVAGNGSSLSITETTVLDCTVGLEANAGTTGISRCTFSGNGDGLRLHAAATVENTIVCGSSGSGILKDPSPDVPTPDVRFCDLWDNGTDSVNFEPAASCFSADPVFFDPENGYYCLGYGSPCVNAGTTDGSTQDGSTDIGAHAAVTVGVGDADFEHLQPAVDAVSHRGSLVSVLVGPGTYKGQAGHVRMQSPVALVGASPSSVMLDGTGYFSSGVYVLDGAAGGAVSGFTIANQFARGIWVELRSPDGTPVPFLIRNNIIRDNGRSAIHVFYDSSPRVLNNTLINNARNGVWIEPTCTDLSSPYIANNIIVGNGHSGIADSADNATTPWADYNNVYGNSEAYAGFYPGSHELSVDPGFVDPAADDYRLVRCSPCVDAGDPASQYSREPEPNGHCLNMGAYGNTPEAAASASFADVPCQHWALPEIEACLDADIVAGYSDGTYRPSLAVTRDQMAVYISRALAGGDGNVPDFADAPTFPDVGEEHWALDYVEYAVHQAVVAGYDDGHYHPEYVVTRDQMAVYVARALVAPTGEAALADYVPADPRNFPDVPSDFWSYKHVEYCVQNGVVQGYQDGLYHPDEVVTRAQMAVYVARAFDLPT